jgi:hypothetical protein
MDSRPNRKKIGIDFDNTLIGYDEVFVTAGKARKLLQEGFVGSKQQVRDSIRLLPDGEISWQKLQGFVYGKGVSGAVMFDGVADFLRRCRRRDAEVFIVSHKTEYGHYDPLRINLRQAALEWMEARGFFCDQQFGIPRRNVYFGSTRSEKLELVAQIGCTHFIDDLEEVLTDPEFPPGIRRILFGPQASASPKDEFIVCPTWDQVAEAVFDDDR